MTAHFYKDDKLFIYFNLFVSQPRSSKFMMKIKNLVSHNGVFYNFQGFLSFYFDKGGNKVILIRNCFPPNPYLQKEVSHNWDFCTLGGGGGGNLKNV